MGPLRIMAMALPIVRMWVSVLALLALTLTSCDRLPWGWTDLCDAVGAEITVIGTVASAAIIGGVSMGLHLIEERRS